MSDIPRMGGTVIEFLHHLQPQLHLAWHGNGISKIGSVILFVEEIAVITEEIGDALTFFLEGCNIKGGVLLHVCLIKSGLYQTIGSSGEVDIAHAVDGPQVTHINGICHLCLLGILHLQGLIGHLTVEITSFLKGGLPY